MKKGTKFVFKCGSEWIHSKVMTVKAVTKDGKAIRTYRAIDGRVWIPVSSIREATKEEIKLNSKVIIDESR